MGGGALLSWPFPIFQKKMSKSVCGPKKMSKSVRGPKKTDRVRAYQKSPKKLVQWFRQFGKHRLMTRMGMKRTRK